MSQSRDEIAEQVVALAGSVSSEKAAKMRELVRAARLACPLEERVAALEATVKAAWDNDAKGHRWNEERITELGFSISRMRERVREIVREEIAHVRGGEDPHAAPSPASIPDWVPSEDEIADFMRQANRRANGLAWYRPVSAELHAIRALIASRAPAAPVVDVHRLIQDYTSDRDSSASDAMTRALAAQGVRTKGGAS